jgi:ribonuclease HII
MRANTTQTKQPDLIQEYRLRQLGLERIAGIDETGRGAWAGPVIAAAVVLPMDRLDLIHQLEGIRDSKIMTHKQRMIGAGKIQQIALDIGLGRASSSEVDQLGVIGATRQAMSRAIDALHLTPQHLLIDHIGLAEVPINQTSISKGDAIVLSIAAASVLAKVTRDALMVEFDRQYPGYTFSNHKGYGTRQHRRALQELGPTAIHRRTFRPMSQATFQF